MLMAILGANLLGDMFASKVVIRTGEGIIKAGHDF